MKYLLFFSLAISYIFPEKEKLNLEKVLQLARRQNPYLLAERLNLRIAEGELVRAKTLPNPVFNSQELFKMRSNPIPASNRQDWVQITQSIPVAGQRAYSIQLAKDSLKLVKNQILEFERNLYFLVSTQYLNTQRSYERLDVINQNLESIKTLLKVNAIRLKSESITKAEYMRTENLWETYSVELQNEQTQLKNQTRELKFLLSLEKDPEIENNPSVNSKEKLPKYEDLFNYALKNRTDILVANSNVYVARSNLKVQEAFAYPTPEIGFIYNPQNGQEYAGTFITIPIPIFDRNQGNIIGAKSELEKSLQFQLALEKQVSFEVKNSLANLETAMINYDRFEKILQNSQKIVEIVRYSYLKGGTTVIDFLDAQRTWFEAQNNFIDAKYQLLLSKLELDYTTGKLLENVYDNK